MIYKQILEEKQKIETQLHAINQKLAVQPAGNLLCARNGNHYKWYLSENSSKTYIPKNDRTIAEAFAAKKYLVSLKNDLTQELIAINFYLRHHQTESKTYKLLHHPEFQSLLAPYFQLNSPELKDWATANFEHNSLYPDKLIHKTASGILVRSKSESLIENALYTNKIPFRYECALKLGTSTIYPDFTILHPRTRELFYWEHFGMIDDEQYRQKAYSKIQLYASHKIYQNLNLITTFETIEHPFNLEKAERIVEEYFL